MASQALAISCSPRRGGNSDAAAELFSRGIEAAGGACRTLHLRDHPVSPCVGCGACAKGPAHACPLAEEDQGGEVFAAVLEASLVCLVSPIYFYHVPALFKALIDRGQRFYNARLAGAPEVANLPPKQAFPILIAGRKTGERLVEGALLSLKYFLSPLNITLADPLTLRGLDARGDLNNNVAARAAVLARAKRAGAAAS